MSDSIKIHFPMIRQLRADEMQAFIDLLEVSFKDSLEDDRVDISKVRTLMRKMNRPHYKLMARIMGVKSEFYVIEHNNRIVSGVTLGLERGEMTVGNIMTHPDYRRQGLARRLLRFSEDRAKTLGIRQLNLSVRAENTSAVRLYTSENYQRNYHAGKFRLDVLNCNLQSDSPDVYVQLIDHVDQEKMNSMLDDCFPSFYFESRNRERWIKDYIPSRILRYIAKKVAGQTINTYSFYLKGDEYPRGYIQASQSRVDDQISLTSPILLEDDNDILLHVLPQVLQYEYVPEGPSVCTLSVSMHRDDAIKKIEQVGFAKVRESLSMVKTL